MTIVKRMTVDVEDAAALLSKGLELMEVVEDRTNAEGALIFVFGGKGDVERIKEQYIAHEIDSIEFEEALKALNNLRKGVLKKTS